MIVGDGSERGIGETVMRLKSSAGPKQGGAEPHAFSPAWGKVCGALCVLAVLVLLTGCSSAASTLIPVRDGDLWGYVHPDGTWAIKAQFTKVLQFSEGLASVYVDGKWGYINQSGQFMIKPQYVEAFNFTDGLARVATKPTGDLYVGGGSVGTAFGWIDKTGKFVIAPRWDGADDFEEGLAVVAQGKDPEYSSFGYINTKGEVVIPLKFQDAGSFSEGLAYAMSGGKWGYIDSKGSWVVTPRFGTGGGLLTKYYPPYYQYTELGVSRFHDGYAVVWDAGKNFDTGVAHFIDKTGKEVFGRTFEAAGEFSDGLAAVEVNGKWGFIDTSGRMAIQPQFFIQVTSLPGFSQGLAAVYKEHYKVGYIDKTGKWVIQPKYASGNSFWAAGVAHVGVISNNTFDQYAGLIDRNGRVVYSNNAELSTSSTSAK